MKSAFLEVSAQRQPKEIVLGWNAMPSYGRVAQIPTGTELVAMFIDETRAQTPAACDEGRSFWNALMDSAAEVRLAA